MTVRGRMIERVALCKLFAYFLLTCAAFFSVPFNGF